MTGETEMPDWNAVQGVGVPALTAIIGALLALVTLRSKERSDRAQQELARASLTVTTQAARDQAQSAFDAATAATLTERLKSLMEGYENRITDLTRDLGEYRERQRRLENEFAVHKMICNGCIHYQQHIRDQSNAASSA